MRVATWIFFGAMVLVQLAAPAYMAWVREDVMGSGEVYRFRCDSPDPYDLMRGRYLTVRIKDDTAPMPADFHPEGGKAVYAGLGKDKDGFAIFTEVRKQPFKDGDYLALSTRAWDSGDGKVHVQTPFDRFYLNEAVAPQADQWYRQAVADSSKPIWAEVRVKRGIGVVTDLKQDGKSFRDLLRSQPVK